MPKPIAESNTISVITRGCFLIVLEGLEKWRFNTIPMQSLSLLDYFYDGSRISLAGNYGL